ncbi:putative sporulation hydrolase CotR [Andreprevotia sp. IGB-42]|uniref:patatin-like phospholipase family protein n=1 Tax=Andreprevotia sp. IGB-42 TaxID=2497473 RepID=UPI00157EEEF2|nr:patatin-like phospholipase family protein [Andreprevotia sp. IGB-42]KAF0811319.1 putative sporulation hydrolase CotR [Andreprevotia sp. IGB-42]
MPKTPDPAPYRILSIDGGGLRGIIPLAILENIDKAVPGWRSGINMYAGTSTGALIALGLAKGMEPAAIMDVYLRKCGMIFERSLWEEVTTLDELTGPKYDSTNREDVCHGLLDNARLRDYLSDDGSKGNVVIASFDVDDRMQPDPAKRRWRAKVFHNLPTVDGSDDGGEIAYRVAMRTSAAPTYFGSYDGFVDGGVFANNPSMCALAQTQDRRLKTAIPPSRCRRCACCRWALAPAIRISMARKTGGWRSGRPSWWTY